MQIALVDDELIFAAPNTLKTATCPSCESVVELRCREGTYFWRHRRVPRGGCPGMQMQATDETTDLGRLLAAARECEGNVVELAGGQRITLDGPGVVVLVRPEGEG